MSSSLRRYEILLPLRFNDGSPVPDELVGQTILELRQQFHAISSETQVIRGHWQHQGEEFRDELGRNYHRVDGYPLKAKLKEARERAGTAAPGDS